MRIPGRHAALIEVPLVDHSRDKPGKPYDSSNENTSKTDEQFTHNAQPGVLAIEATTTAWTRKTLWLAYVIIWIVSFVDALQQGTTGNLVPYVTSNFSQHSLTAYTFTLSGIIGGVLKLPLAKFLDVTGRPQGFALTILLMVFGLILMAVCNSVQVFAAAQIFYWVGYNGLVYTLGIFVADTSSLKNRGIMFACLTSPYIVTVWAAGPLAQAFLSGPGWRWCYGAFAIITLVVTIPLWALFQLNYMKAVKDGIIVPVKSQRTFLESVKYYAVEFDVGGLLLVTTGLIFFLLPFNIYSLQKEGWKSPLVISLLIIGLLLLIAFGIYEKSFAPKTFMPYELLMDRTVDGTCILAAVLFISWYIWHSYFSSFLQVVNGLSITESNYVLNIYNIGSCVASLLVGIAMRYTGRFKWIALWFGVPCTILGVGLLIYVRQPGISVGYIIMTQILISFAGGACVITEQIAIMAATDHQYVAVVLAIEGMFTSIGGGIGSSVSVAIWTSVFKKSLAQYLPAHAQSNIEAIYAQLPVQLSYPKGSDVRIAIERAYGDSQKLMNICATVVLALAIPAVMMWRDIRIKDFTQTKGRVV